jgi:hypothetical protein
MNAYVYIYIYICILEQHSPMPPASQAENPLLQRDPNLSPLPIVVHSPLPPPGRDMQGQEILEKLVMKKNRETLRVKLGSLIHRKLASITTDLNHLMNTIPEKWRALLQDAYAATNAALHDSSNISQLRSQSAKLGTPTSNVGEINVYIDGLQPYVHYRRSVATTIYIYI